jgi:hypothetical protein
MAFTPDGAILFAVAKPNQRGERRDLYKWDVDTGKLLSSRNYLCNGDLPLKISGDSRTLVYGANGCALRVADTQYLSDIWTLSLGERVGTIKADLSYDGNLLITSHENDLIRFWDIAQQKEIKVVDPNSEVILSRNILDLVTSPEGTKLAVVGDGKVQIWGLYARVGEDAALRTIETPTPNPTSVKMSRWSARDVQVYDNFDTDGLDPDLWGVDTDRPGFFSYAPDGGLLQVASKAPLNAGGILFILEPYRDKPIDQVQVLEARLGWQGIEGGFGLVKIAISANLYGDWWTACYIGSHPGDAQPYFTCDVVSGGKQEFQTALVDVSQGRLYRARIEIDPKSGALQFYLNGEILDTYLPDDAARLLKAKFIPMVGMWVSEGTVLKAEIDEIRVSR